MDISIIFIELIKVIILYFLGFFKVVLFHPLFITVVLFCLFVFLFPKQFLFIAYAISIFIMFIIETLKNSLEYFGLFVVSLFKNIVRKGGRKNE